MQFDVPSKHMRLTYFRTATRSIMNKFPDGTNCDSVSEYFRYSNTLLFRSVLLCPRCHSLCVPLLLTNFKCRHCHTPSLSHFQNKYQCNMQSPHCRVLMQTHTNARSAIKCTVKIHSYSTNDLWCVHVSEWIF